MTTQNEDKVIQVNYGLKEKWKQRRREAQQKVTEFSVLLLITFLLVGFAIWKDTTKLIKFMDWNFSQSDSYLY